MATPSPRTSPSRQVRRQDLGGDAGHAAQGSQAQAIVSALWGYFGLPPSRLSVYYYALPTLGYLEQGGFYPRGRSQAISDALVKFIRETGWNGQAWQHASAGPRPRRRGDGVKTADGAEYSARVVVANANPIDVFGAMLDGEGSSKDYLSTVRQMSVSLSCFPGFPRSQDGSGSVSSRSRTARSSITPGFDDDAAYEACLGPI